MLARSRLLWKILLQTLMARAEVFREVRRGHLLSMARQRDGTSQEGNAGVLWAQSSQDPVDITQLGSWEGSK